MILGTYPSMVVMANWNRYWWQKPCKGMVAHVRVSQITYLPVGVLWASLKSGGFTGSRIYKEHTASILANVLDNIEINTGRAIESSCDFRTRVPAPLKLTRQKQGVRQCGKAGHQEWSEDWVETGRLSERQVRVPEPNLNHQPRDRLPAPRLRSACR